MGQQIPHVGYRDRKPDPPRIRPDRRVHPDHLPIGIEQRPAGISRIERSGVLDDIGDQPAVLCAQSTSQCAYHAG